MRKGILTLLGLLTAGAAAASAQSAANNPPVPMATPVGPAASQPPTPDTGRYGSPWNRSWEAIIQAAGNPAPPANRPAEDAEPESPANRFWIDGDYLLWWTKNGPLPAPLVTTGPATAPIIGGLTQPNTQVVFGGSSQNYGVSNGLRLDTGLWLDGDRHWGIDGGFFVLEQRAQGFAVNSTAAGTPVLAQPLINPATGREFTEVIALPGLIVGGVADATHSQLQGWEINALTNLFRTDRVTLNFLVGFRAASLDEDLSLSSAFSPLASGFLTFPGRTVNTGSMVGTYDSFQTDNHFYGLQLGGRLVWTTDELSVTAVGKLAVGGDQEIVRVVGESALFAPGALPLTVPGGVYAVSSNSGRHYRDEFAVMPEAGLQVSYRFSTHIEGRLGYSFLYISRVARPGNQISRNVEPGSIPTDPAFGSATGTAPGFQFHASDYWAQGFTLGLLFRF